ncbi:MAG: DUF4037 domain-containing protein [Firmicutes bacterium]|nr:DUF4037 domain-containing protein [Bacillota bacterium]
MKGLDLSKKYYEEYGRKMIAETVPEISHRIAVGLAGDGSQCFGFDDEISRDHDFAPGFCMWLTDDDYQKYGTALQEAYHRLPDDYMGILRRASDASGRLGVSRISDFYSEFTGCTQGPVTNGEWLMCPETSLAACTNGEIFYDPVGRFSEIRSRILEFYPEDVLRKKIAARAAVMAQSGQYNLPRCLQRSDKVAATLAAGRFTEATLSMVHLLNRRYMPFYKWSFRSACSLEKLSQVPELLCELHHSMKTETVEQICALVAEELCHQEFSTFRGTFLQDHLSDIMSAIKDPEIAALPPMADFNF